MTSQDSIITGLTLEQTLGTIPSGLFVVDKEMRVTYWNPAAERITGFSVSDALGQHCSFLQGIPCSEGCGLYNNEIPKPIIGIQCTIVTKTGKTIQLLKNMDYLRNNSGEIIGGIESFIDITRQKNLEDSLREQAANLESNVKERTAELKKSEARFRTVLENMDDLAYIATEDYTLSFMNRSMRDIFGDRIGQPCYEVLHNEPGVCSWCPMSKVFRQRTVRDERQLGSDGRVYEIVHTPLPEEDGRQQKLAVCRDITERKKSEMELREVNRELDAFTHSISHDMRGILSPVVTYMDFLQTSYQNVLDEQILQILSEVERQSERAITLLDDLLDLAQVGHVSPAQYPTDTDRVVEEVIMELRAKSCADREFRKDKLQEIWLPETLTYQIFVNLISNACHYAPETAGPIEVGCWEEKHNVIYFVRDHGPGVPFNEREVIFDIFYRGKNAMEQRGTGVGLAIVRKAALRCGGEVWVEQTPGGGATFCVSLPKTPTNGKASESTP